MKKAIKKTVPIILALLLLLQSVSLTLALGEANSKEEVVYANLTNSGEVEKVYIVNILNVIKTGLLLDYGHYTEVLNLTDTEPIKLNGAKIVLNPSTLGRFYYQGYPKSLDLPWNIDISYFLNGEQVNAEALGGATGQLEIKIKTTRNEKTDPSFFEKYMLQMSVTLSTERCADITCKQATFANVGKDKLLTIMVLPGTDGDISITADVVNFAMDSISINGVSFKLALDSGLIDSSQFSSQFGALASGVNELYDGAVQLENGAKELSKGLNTLRKNSSRLLSGASQLTKGMDELAKGIKTLSAEVDKITETVNSMVGSSSDIEEGLDKIGAAILLDANKRLKDICGSSAPTLTWKNYKRVLEGLISSTGKTELSDMLVMLTSVDLVLNNLNANSDDIVKGAKELTGAVKELNSGATQLSDGMRELNTGLNEFADGIILLDDGGKALSTGATQLREGIGLLRDGTSGIDGEVENTISTMLRELAGEDFVPTSFTAKTNDNVSAVQFVLKTGSIKAPVETAPEQIQPQPSNLWERILDIFGLFNG